MRTFTIKDEEEYIELYKLLKAASMIGSGGEAKLVISQEYVTCNGEIETRKRFKVRPGTIVEFNDEKIKVVADE